MKEMKELPSHLDRSKYYVLTNERVFRILRYERNKWCVRTKKEFYGVDIFQELSRMSGLLRTISSTRIIVLDNEVELNKYLMGLELLR